MRQHEAQRQLRKGHSRRQDLFELVHAFHGVGEILRIEVARSPVSVWELCVLAHFSTQAPFVERYPDNNADVQLLAGRK